MDYDDFLKLVEAETGIRLKSTDIDSARQELDGILRDRSASEISPPSSIDTEKRTVECVIGSERPVVRYDWENNELYEEVLLMDGYTEDGNSKAGIPLLNSHSRWSIDSVLGTTTDIHVEGDKLVGIRHFSSTAEKYFTMVKEGHLRNQSLGYVVSKTTAIEPGSTALLFGRTFKNEGSLKRVYATEWRASEDSIVIIPADPSCGMRCGSGASAPEDNNISERRQTMPQLKEAKQPEVAKAPEEQVNNDNIRKEEVNADEIRRAERERIAEITEMCRTLEISDEARTRMIDEGMDMNAARALVVDEMSKRSEQTKTPNAAHVTNVVDAYDRAKDAMVDAIVVRGNPGLLPGGSVNKNANDFMGMSMMDMVRWMNEKNNVAWDYNARPDEVFSRALATSDLPNLLKSTVERTLWAGWDYAGENYTQWTGTGSARDFRVQSVVRALGNFSLEEVKEGEEYRYESMTEESNSFQLAKYGKAFAFTWEALVNDDLSALTKYPEEFGRASATLEAELAYNFLLNNPAIYDGVTLFHANHNNLAATGSAPTEASVNAALLAFAMQKDASGKHIRLMPEALIAPMSLKSTIEKLLNSPYNTDGAAVSSQVNTVQGAIGKRIYEPRLDVAGAANGAMPWFLVGPARNAVQIVHLRGYERPQVMSEQGFMVDGFRAKCRHCVGAYADSFQAFYMNPGA